MHQIKQPPSIIIGNNSSKNFKFKNNSLIITSSGTKSRGWLDHLDISNYYLFDKVEPNPSMETVIEIINQFSKIEITDVVGIGGGSSLDVAKYVAYKLKKKKILIPTTFGSGSEVTRIAVLKINGKKKSFHHDKFFADTAIVDSKFIFNTPNDVFKNSAIDALAQCSEGFDSNIGNFYTKFMCERAFNYLESGILNDNYEQIVLGSLLSGLGFGNCSTTLGHALSYVFSNEGFSHGHALAFTTAVAHKFNNSKFYSRFLKIVKKLDFKPIRLKMNLNDATDLILTDKKHIDNNPKLISSKDIVSLLQKINFENVLN